jgi:pyrimidine-nucleoside phosphorylase
MRPSPTELITKKRDGQEHGPGEIAALVTGFMNGALTDYQMSAWLMAALLRGLSERETLALTEAMLGSGKQLELRRTLSPCVDKHSTGGVGDKLSIPLAPLVAACGVRVPMVAGRSLGHTGGTLDKLESIPGYDVRLDVQSFRKVLRSAGASIIGATDALAPADRRIYALRDVSGTVESQSLIVASILSKKLAVGLNGLVLDVKCGRGAFMQTPKRARELAQNLVRVATALGTPTVALITNMDEPLGTSIGNALEIRESIAILRGDGPPDSTELILRLGEEMLLLGEAEAKPARGRARADAGRKGKRQRARARLEEALASGRALEVFARMVALHGGNAGVIEKPELLPQARHRLAVLAQQAGVISSVDARALAEVAIRLGAGRLRTQDSIDPAVGVELLKKRGDKVARGDVLCLLHTQSKTGSPLALAQQAFEIGAHPPGALRLVRERITG